MSSKKMKEGGRVGFERGLPANIMAIDGTWRRACTVRDVSNVGATLVVEGSVQGLNRVLPVAVIDGTGLSALQA